VPTLTVSDQFLRFVSTATKVVIDAIPAGGRRNPFPLDAAKQQVVSDRFTLSADHLRAGDHLLSDEQHRTAIGRYYYAMYHAARGVTFAEHGGDDFEKHSILPRNLSTGLDPDGRLSVILTDARLLRNEADYDAYPNQDNAWRSDAIGLSTEATSFVANCRTFATTQGMI
jgi:uncharacterized protein (UPF0332 family)